jgi:5-formyltetrahydrofolate cyclo-ligase
VVRSKICVNGQLMRFSALPVLTYEVYAALRCSKTTPFDSLPQIFRIRLSSFWFSSLSDFKALKKSLRLEALARRDALPVEYRIEHSLGMADVAISELSVLPSEVVAAFMPMRSEVDVRPLMFALGAAGALICVPAILDKTTIEFRELVRGAPLIDMGFGTVGPGPGAAVLDPTLMLVPLAAFDDAGNRIGYGAGYYDRAIQKLREKGIAPRLVGVAFDCQQVEAVPFEAHDVPLDAILTESGLRRFKRCD